MTRKLPTDDEMRESYLAARAHLTLGAPMPVPEPEPEEVIAPEIVFDAMTGETLERIQREKELPITAVPTPFPGWNDACRGAGGGIGLARGWHITLAGNTGQGKSLVALNMAGCAIESGENVAFISLEMSQSELATRLLSIVSGEDVRELEQGHFYNAITFARARKAMDEIAERTGASVFVNRRSVSSLEQIHSAIRYQREYNGCNLVIVDYMQLAAVKNARNDVERITEVSSTVRRTAKEENVTTVGLSQYNRETSKDRENPPTPQGLHGGSALENDSDQVLLLDHTEYKREPSGATTRLMLAKNRHGPQMILGVRFNYTTLAVRQTEIVADMRRKDKQQAATPPKQPAQIRSAHPDKPPQMALEDRGEAWEEIEEVV